MRKLGNLYDKRLAVLAGKLGSRKLRDVVLEQGRETIESRLGPLLLGDLIEPPLESVRVSVYEPRNGFSGGLGGLIRQTLRPSWAAFLALFKSALIHVSSFLPGSRFMASASFLPLSA